MDDLTATDYRLLLSLLGYAIVLPEQRYRIERALMEKRDKIVAADVKQRRAITRKREDRGFCGLGSGGRGRAAASRGLDETGHERN